MPSWFDLGNIWKTLKEVDLRPIRAEAEQLTWIAIVGEDENARADLEKALCQEPRKQLPGEDASQAGPDPIGMPPGEAARDLTADLILLLVGKQDVDAEQELVRNWHRAGKKVVVIFDPAARINPSGWQGASLLRGLTSNRAFLEDQVVPAAVALMPDRALSLARYYPLFRFRVARQLISDTSVANASYSLSTGLAEIIPILDVPFNVADIIVLTKAQAIMAYKLGLLLGLSGRWQDHLTAFGGTVGSGFLWRQVARELVGIIPVWGLIPKVSLAYAGTYVLGEGILYWYTTGRKVSPEMMRQFYQDAFEHGKTLARSLAAGRPRRRFIPNLPRPKFTPRLASGATRICPNCGARNPGSFNYCGSCGASLEKAAAKS